MKTRILTTLSVFLLAAAAPAPAQTTVAENNVVHSISVEGRKNVDLGLILSTSGLKVGEELTADRVQTAIKRLFSLGLFSGDIRIEGARVPEGVDIFIIIQENAVIDRLDVQGAKAVSESDVMDALTIHEGGVLNQRALALSIEKILDLYKEKGYLTASIDPQTQEVNQDEVRLRLNIDEGDRVQVKKIEIYGNLLLNDSQIRKVMKTKEDRWWRGADFVEDTFESDLDKIIALYGKQGYIDAEITDKSWSIDSRKKNIYIEVFVREGRQYTVGGVTWEGNTKFDDDRVDRVLELDPGEIFDGEVFQKSSENLITMYREVGHLYVGVIPEQEKSGDKINIHYVINEGEPSRINKILVEGNTTTREKVIRREMTIYPGQLYRQSALLRTHREIFNLQYFEEVIPDIEPAGNGNQWDVNLIFRVKEKPSGQFQFGTTFSADEGFGGFLGLMHPNIFGSGKRVQAQWERSSYRNNLTVGYTEPWLFDTPTLMEITGQNYRRWYPSLYFDEYRKGGAIRLGRPLPWLDYTDVGVRYNLERRRLDLDPNAPVSIQLYEGNWLYSSVRFDFDRDSRDNYLFPSVGSRFLVSTEFARSLSAGSADYRKYTLEHSWFFPVINFAPMSNLVLSIKTKAGFLDEVAGTGLIPYTEYFFPGGAPNWDGVIRGYADPRNEASEVAGGRAMFVLNCELTIPLVPQQIYFLAFADAGNSWPRVGDFSPSQLKKGAGIGLRIQTPMGPLSLEYAYGFDRIGGGKWRPHFQFGMFY